MPDKLYLKVGASTETGYVRKENQDRMSWIQLPGGQLYIIADGMGGHAGGAKAAELTIQKLEKYLSEAAMDLPIEEIIQNAFEKTNLEIYDQAHAGDPATEGMGSTVAILIIRDHIAKIAHVGDSRVYLYRKGKLQQLTKDHTQVQRMVDAKMLTPEQARNHPSAHILDHAIGNRPTISVDISPDLILENGDGFLLCTDGLSGYVDDHEIEASLDNSLTPQENVDRLISIALQKGGEDNVTIQFVQYGENSKVYRKKYRITLQSIVLFSLICIFGGEAIYITHQITMNPEEDNVVILKKVIHQQICTVTQCIGKMTEVTERFLK